MASYTLKLAWEKENGDGRRVTCSYSFLQIFPSLAAIEGHRWIEIEVELNFNGSARKPMLWQEIAIATMVDAPCNKKQHKQCLPSFSRSFICFFETFAELRHVRCKLGKLAYTVIAKLDTFQHIFKVEGHQSNFLRSSFCAPI